jgi:putative serine protease PepD
MYTSDDSLRTIRGRKSRAGKIRFIAGGVVAASVIAFGAACSSVGGSDSPSTADDQAANVPTASEPASFDSVNSVADLVEAADASVVRVATGGGVGTGFIISDDGYIVTNNHVVESNSRASVEVTLSDGSVHDATIVGTDPRADLAVLKIDATGLQALALAEMDDVRVGEDVVAMGYALDLTGGDGAAYSVSRGIVSAKNRAISGDANAILGAIQTDAAVNHGNSGGPLLDMDGDVVGVITSLVPDSSTGSVAQGIALAVGSDVVDAVVDEIIATGQVDRGVLGISNFSALRPAEAEAAGLDADTEGVVIGQGGLAASGAASRGGLQDGDIITEVGGYAVANETGLAVALVRLNAGETVEVKVYRGGQELTLDVTLGSNQV